MYNLLMASYTRYIANFIECFSKKEEVDGDVNIYTEVWIYDTRTEKHYFVELMSQFTEYGFTSLYAPQIIHDKVMAKDFDIQCYDSYHNTLTLQFIIKNAEGYSYVYQLACPERFPYLDIDLDNPLLTIEDCKKCIKSYKHKTADLQNRLD